jgi:hypothetical protein
VPSQYYEFRAKLDAVLRQRDPAALRAFLVAEGQWDEGATTDAERALWLMIATSRALSDLHAVALQWLTDHGYNAEVHALLGRPKPEPRPAGGKEHGPRKGKPLPKDPPSAPKRRD